MCGIRLDNYGCFKIWMRKLKFKEILILKWGFVSLIVKLKMMMLFLEYLMGIGLVFGFMYF